VGLTRFKLHSTALLPLLLLLCWWEHIAVAVHAVQHVTKRTHTVNYVHCQRSRQLTLLQVLLQSLRELQQGRACCGAKMLEHCWFAALTLQ
jgi:hypothetical protein